MACYTQATSATDFIAKQLSQGNRAASPVAPKISCIQAKFDVDERATYCYDYAVDKKCRHFLSECDEMCVWITLIPSRGASWSLYAMIRISHG